VEYPVAGAPTLPSPGGPTLRQTVLGSTAPARVCPGPGHTDGVWHHCAGKHCIELDSDLLIQWWAPGSFLTSSDVLASFEGHRELSDGHRLPLLVHLQGLTGITRDARNALLECSLSARIALVGAGPVDQVIAAFAGTGYAETRYFACTDAAGRWARAAWIGT